MYCRNCGRESKDNSQICSICGQDKYSGGDYCPNCGHYCLSNEETCFYCNASLTSTNTMNMQESQMPPSPPPMPGFDNNNKQSQYDTPPEFDITLNEVNGSAEVPRVVNASKKICSSCGLQIESSTSVCPYCGKDPDALKNYCGTCGSPITEGLDNCPGCGSSLKKVRPQINYQNNNYQQTNYQQNNYQDKSYQVSGEKPKDFVVTLLLCIFLGYFGAHRFYTGHIFLGLLYLLSCGLIGSIGMWIDLILIITDNYKDKNGNKLKK